MKDFYSESMLDLNRKEHRESLEEALLFCCVTQGTKEEKIKSAIAALRKCARWFPTKGEDYAHSSLSSR